MKLNKYLWSFFILFIIGGCENLEETYSNYTGDGTIRYLGKCKDLSVSPGWQRLYIILEDFYNHFISKQF